MPTSIQTTPTKEAPKISGYVRLLEGRLNRVEAQQRNLAHSVSQLIEQLTQKPQQTEN